MTPRDVTVALVGPTNEIYLINKVIQKVITVRVCRRRKSVHEYSSVYIEICLIVCHLFNDNLLILSHSIIFSSSLTAVSVLLFRILPLKDLMVLNKVVSSAYIIKVKLLLAF